MSSAFDRRLALSFLAGVGIAATVAASAFAQAIPDKEINRDLVRRALLDTCVYAQAAKEEGAKKDKVVDACQCASTKAMKGVKEEEITAVSTTKSLPDAWYKATTEAYEGCAR